MSIPLTACLALAGAVPFAAAAAGPAAQEEIPVLEEPESGHEYPVRMDPLEGEDEVYLTGVAIREKTILAVNVYSFGLYVDRAGLREDLAKWKGKKGKEIEDDPKLFAKLLEDNFTKQLRIRFCRDVDADDVRSAFEDSLEPRLLELRKDEPGSKEDKLKDLAKFRGFFELDELKKGKELVFTWLPGGKLETSVDGKRQETIESVGLCWALFDVYLGEDPITKKGKERLTHRIPFLLGK